MEHVQVGSGPNNFGSGRGYRVQKLLSSMLLVPLAFAGDPQLVKNLNAQLGRTINTIVIEPFYVKDARKIPREIRPTECQPTEAYWLQLPDWHFCVVEMQAIPRVFTGSSWVDALVASMPSYSRTTSDRVVISTPQGPVIVPPVTTTTETPRTNPAPVVPGRSDMIDLLVYFAFDKDSTQAQGWLAYCVVYGELTHGGPAWHFMDSREIVLDNRGHVRLASTDGENHESSWYGIHEVRR